MTLTYRSFIQTVQDAGGMSRGEAEQATRATLETLGERVSQGEAAQLGEQLPGELRPVVVEPGAAEPFGAEEFLRRVAQREGVDEPAAEEHARAVFAAVRHSVSAEEIADVRAQLSRDIEALLDPGAASSEPRGQRPRTASAEEFYRRVADQALLDVDRARVVTEAALEALGDRISGGEADDLAALLPPGLEEPLARGEAKSNGAARPLSLAEFLAEIAELAGISEEDARLQARVVFGVLRDHVGENELRDVFEQVPDDYAIVLGPRP